MNEPMFTGCQTDPGNPTVRYERGLRKRGLRHGLNGYVKRKRRNSQAYAKGCARRVSTRPRMRHGLFGIRKVSFEAAQSIGEGTRHRRVDGPFPKGQALKTDFTPRKRPISGR